MASVMPPAFSASVTVMPARIGPMPRFAITDSSVSGPTVVEVVDEDAAGSPSDPHAAALTSKVTATTTRANECALLVVNLPRDIEITTNTAQSTGRDLLGRGLRGGAL